MPEHAHDWPVLSLFVIGGYTNRTDAGTAAISGPSAILYRAGAAHRNAIGSDGFEQIEIEFDPCWVGQALLPDTPVAQWLDGGVAPAASALAQIACAASADEAQIRSAIRRFVERACREPAHNRPEWVATVAARLRRDTTLSISDLAREAWRHPSWLGTAYRRATGEGLLASAARFRVARAACLLRESDAAPAHVAALAGFCDQSHMNRTFRRVLGRTPTAVREDRRFFRQVPAQGTD